MEKFVEVKKEYSAYKCVACNADVVVVKAPAGTVLLCVGCVVAERLIEATLPAVQPAATQPAKK